MKIRNTETDSKIRFALKVVRESGATAEVKIAGIIVPVKPGDDLTEVYHRRITFHKKQG